MKIVSATLNVVGTVPELRALADAIESADAATAAEIRHYADPTYPDDLEMRHHVYSVEGVRAVLAVIGDNPP